MRATSDARAGTLGSFVELVAFFFDDELPPLA
jgi:hypothetical protein